MKRLIAILLFVPATAWAQEGVVLSRGETALQQTQAARPQADAGSRRRPSMVGYIGDGSITSQMRVRFDGGYGVTAADRAEFFYGKCGCYRGLAANDPAFDPNAAGPGPGVLTNLNFGQLYLLGEYAPNPRFSVFAEVPFRFLRPESFAAGTGSFGSQNGLADVRFGVKGGVVSTADRQLTASLQVVTPSGDSRKGLGTDHASIEPVLIYQEHSRDRMSIEAQFGGVIPTDGSAGVPTSSSDKFSGSVLYYGIGPSFNVYQSATTTFAPVVELVGWRVLGGFQTAAPASADGINIVNIKIGGRVLFGDRSSIYVGYGHALTDATWYDDIIRLEYRMALGR